MKFSVVIPLYNKEDYILRTIQSVLNQSILDFEVLVIDDGSTDKSVEIVKSIKDKRVRLLRQSNFGVSVARNYGIKEACNNLIAFLDADDYWESEYLFSMSMLITKFPKSIMYSSGYIIHNKTSSYVRNIQNNNTHSYSIVENYEYYRIINKWGMQASSTVIRKTDFINYDNYFPVGIQQGEDSWVWDRFSLLGDVATMSDVLVHYSGDIPNQITSNRNNNIICATVYGVNEFRNKYRLSLKKNLWSEYYIKSLLISKINLCHRSSACIQKIINDDMTQQYLSRLTISMLKSKNYIILNSFLVFSYLLYHPRVIRNFSPNIIKKIYKHL
jgi:glycosyltransferase involved in cell wall biosynthesis